MRVGWARCRWIGEGGGGGKIREYGELIRGGSEVVTGERSRSPWEGAWNRYLGRHNPSVS